MRVVCIDASCSIPPGYNGMPFLLKEGEIYTVSQEEHNCYHLVETDRINPTYCYSKKRFIPLSDIDETTFERNYQTQTA